jgi:hypothetical protein
VTVREPLQRLRHVARRPAPVTGGLVRPPRRPVTALRAAAAEAAAGAATLALLDAGPRCCDTLLTELAEHERRTAEAAADVGRTRSRGSDLDGYLALASALEDVAQGVHDAGGWWCRSPGCDPATVGLTGTLRDATRALGHLLTAFPTGDDHAIATVRRRAAEGRCLARRARAAAIEGGDVRDALARMNAIAAVERALAATARAARALQQIELS